MQTKPPVTLIGEAPRTDFAVTSFGVTDKGAVRKVNEDNFLIRERLCLWAVADGMGGHTRGDFASETVVDCLTHVRAWAEPRPLMLDVVARLEDANACLRHEARRIETDAIGATVICLLTLGRQGLVVWAGDSRAYRIRDGRIEQLSKDHSVVEDMIDAGLIARGDAESHPQAHVLTRAVGAADTLDLEFEHVELKAGDVYLLCTDGLTRSLGDTEIRDTVLCSPSPEAACRALIQAALDRGARDNVTVVTVAIAPGAEAR